MENNSIQIKITAKNGIENADKYFETINIKPNIVGDVNILTQDLINKPNKKYVIKYIFDLNKEEITLPDNCILEFDGGGFKNGTINLNNAYIIPSYNCLADNKNINELEIEGNPKNGTFYLYADKPMWFHNERWIDALYNMGILGEIKVREINAENEIIEENPAEGQQIHVIYKNDYSSVESCSVTVDKTKFVTPTGQDLTLEIPVDGYCEVNFLKINNKIYVRGI